MIKAESYRLRFFCAFTTIMSSLGYARDDKEGRGRSAQDDKKERPKEEKK